MAYTPPILGHENWASDATISGGSFLASRPRANMQDIRLFRLARSADLSSASTYVIADLTTARPIRLVVITNHNLTAAATIRVRAATSEAGLTSAAPVDVTQAVWLGSNTPAGNTTRAGLPIHMPCALVILPADRTYRWWRIDIADAANPDGYVEIGYLQLWQAIEISGGIAFGANLTPETGTIKQETVGLVGDFDRRRSRRTAQFVTDHLSLADADRILDIVRDRDIDQPVFWLPEASPADPGSILRRAFLARLRQMTALEAAWWDGDRGAWNLEEIVGG